MLFRSAGRSKPAARAPEARPELRGNGGIKLGLEAGMSRLEWLRGTFPFRRPVLTLTLSFVVIGGIAGLSGACAPSEPSRRRDQARDFDVPAFEFDEATVADLADVAANSCGQSGVRP